jgi:hypothetical protein
MSGMKVKELMDSLKGDCYRFRVHYPEEWEFGLITGATFFGKRGLVLQHGEDDVSSFTLNPSWLSCEDETQRCIMVEIYLEPGRRFRKRMLPTKKRCPRCGRVLPAEAFNLVRGGRELAGWCRVCNHRYYLDRKEAGFVRKNPSGRRIAHGGYTDAVGRYIDLG